MACFVLALGAAGCNGCGDEPGSPDDDALSDAADTAMPDAVDDGAGSETGQDVLPDDDTTEADSDSDGDAELDAPDPEDATAAVPRTNVTMTGAGGVLRSESQRAVIGVGAPQPAGALEGSTNELLTGPAAARP